MSNALAASRRVKENRFFQNRVEIAPPAPPPLPSQVEVKARPSESRYILEKDHEIQAFLNEGTQVAEGVRRVLASVKAKRKELQNEWDVKAAVSNFVKEYQVGVPNADKEYVRGMKMALRIYLGAPEA